MKTIAVTVNITWIIFNICCGFVSIRSTRVVAYLNLAEKYLAIRVMGNANKSNSLSVFRISDFRITSVNSKGSLKKGKVLLNRELASL